MLKSKIRTSNKTKCFSRVDATKTCSICFGLSVKNGKTSAGEQRFLCKKCNQSRVCDPNKRGYGSTFDRQIVQLKKEGLGIRSVGRILGISASTVLRKILKVADNVIVPEIPENTKFQVDELHTYVGNKKREICVIFSWNKKLRIACSIGVGTRSKLNLKSVVEPLVIASAKNINTDRYSSYIGVVPTKIHTTFKRRNNHIERQNLNLRTHLKRLNRRTICFSKSAAMLLAVVKIYFWG